MYVSTLFLMMYFKLIAFKYCQMAVIVLMLKFMEYRFRLCIKCVQTDSIFNSREQTGRSISEGCNGFSANTQKLQSKLTQRKTSVFAHQPGARHGKQEWYFRTPLFVSGIFWFFLSQPSMLRDEPSLKGVAEWGGGSTEKGVGSPRTPLPPPSDLLYMGITKENTRRYFARRRHFLTMCTRNHPPTCPFLSDFCGCLRHILSTWRRSATRRLL